MVEEKLH